MKKIIISFFIVVTALYSASSESKIIKLIFNALYDKNDISVYVIDKNKIHIIKEAGLSIALTCSTADIVYVSKKPKECKNKPLFTDSYITFRDEEDAIGAFYWTKGRPNIYFLKSRLDMFELKVPIILKQYVMDEL